MARKDGREVETSEFPPFMARVAKAWAERVANGDTYDLAELIEFGRTFDDVVTTAIQKGRERALRNAPPNAFFDWSWPTIGDAAGISRQAASKRWGTVAEQVEAAQENAHEPAAV